MSNKKCIWFVAIVLVFSSLACVAQEAQAPAEAQVRVEVQPPEAYIFLDGTAVGRDSRTLSMSAGKHTIGVYNYGFKPFVKEIDAAAGQNEAIQAFLEADGRGPVSGPWGILQVEGANGAAVLLNGKTPEFVVGHGDEMNHHVWWKQQLILPVGTYDVTVVRLGKEEFSGQVTVPRNERVVLFVDQGGKQEIKSWAEGTEIGPQQRFKAGRTSATIAVAPVSGSIGAAPSAINCNDTVTVSWKTDETLHAYLTAEPVMVEGQNWDLKYKGELPAATTEEVELTGSKQFQPKVTTKYTLRSPGPGGVVLQSVIVPVNPVVQTRFSSLDEPVHFVKIGDKILTQDTTKFNWTVDNADAIIIDEIGAVDAVPARQTVGERSYTPTPKQAVTGPVDEKQIFKLSASNVCGGSDTATATVHIVGDMEPNIASVFFPTAYPEAEHISIGLLHSQEMRLVPIARAFKTYMEHTPDAKLVLVANADARPHENVKLSERRAEKVKAFLLDMGVPADRIEIQAKGTEQLLDENAVKELEAKNPTPMAEQGPDAEKTNTLAYNRRVDIIIVPAALESAKIYPHDAEGSALMWNRSVPAPQAVEKKQ